VRWSWRATSVARATWWCAPNGDLYVALDNAPDGSVIDGVLALRDSNGDGRADLQQRFGPTGGNGIAWDNNQLYFGPDDRVVRWTFFGNELVPSGAPTTIVSGLPFAGNHHRKTVVLDGAGGMFVNIGSQSNSCQVDNRVPYPPGIDPCPELPVRAGVWAFDATRSNQTQADGIRFATELRNMNALAINPADRQLYGVQNGRDQLLENWWTFFDARGDARLPAFHGWRFDRALQPAGPGYVVTFTP